MGRIVTLLKITIIHNHPSLEYAITRKIQSDQYLLSHELHPELEAETDSLNKDGIQTWINKAKAAQPYLWSVGLLT